MAAEDRQRWDDRYRQFENPVDDGGPPRHLAGLQHLLPANGQALDVACGPGRGSLWMARRGLDVWGIDVSPVAIELARARAEQAGVDARFDIVDLDDGLPDGPPVALVLCHMFRDADLDSAVMQRLAPGGVVAVVALSEVGAEPGAFRTAPGELAEAFAGLELLHHSEENGVARFIGRAAGPWPSTRLD